MTQLKINLMWTETSLGENKWMETRGCPETPEKQYFISGKKNETFKFGIDIDCKWVEC